MAGMPKGTTEGWIVPGFPGLTPVTAAFLQQVHGLGDGKRYNTWNAGALFVRNVRGAGFRGHLSLYFGRSQVKR